jgi:uncharacterized protein (TIGR02145 family)
MKITLKSFAFAGAVLGGVLALSACGDDVTKVYQTTEENSGMEIAKSADDFDDCDSASVGKMMFASDENAAYICADPGWTPLSEKTSDGKDGASCTAELFKDSTGYKIMCGEDSVGVVLNGKTGAKGAKGEDGEAGAAGENGTSCAVEMLADSTGYKVVCGEDSVGVILNGLDGNGCTLTDNGDGTLSQVCGETAVTLYKALCGNTPYDPAKSFCHADSVYALCDGKAYDPTKSFCYADSVYAFCDEKAYDPAKSFCHADSLYSCGEKAFDPSIQVCHSERIFGLLNDSRDGKIYRTVEINEQIWMAENLNYAYPKASETATDSLSFCFDNDTANCTTYGRLYTWAAAMDSAAVFSDDGKGCGYEETCTAANTVRGVCPEGWHLPSSDEWKALEKSVADSLYNGETENVGYALKSKSGWTEYDCKTGGSDAFGFGALPAGFRNSYGTFFYVQSYAYFWSSTEHSTYNAYYRYLDYYSTDLTTLIESKDDARSVRCVKD